MPDSDLCPHQKHSTVFQPKGSHSLLPLPASSRPQSQELDPKPRSNPVHWEDFIYCFKQDNCCFCQREKKSTRGEKSFGNNTSPWKAVREVLQGGRREKKKTLENMEMEEAAQERHWRMLITSWVHRIYKFESLIS